LTTYVDSSVLLRIVLGEPAALVEWPSIEPVSSELIRVECLRALERLRHTGALGDDTIAERRVAVLDTLSRFRLVEASRTILERTADPFPVYVATLDAIHLATALELRADYGDLTLATHDAKLASAARALEFTVLGA
jgi:predicted nucleic acid-binding protein